MSRLENLLAADPVAHWLGARLVSVDPVVLEMLVEERHLNFHGVCHGGVLFSLADVAMSLASNLAVAALAIDAHVAFTKPARLGDLMRVTAEEVGASRRIATYRATIDGPPGLLAGFTGTVYRPSRTQS